MNSRIMLNIFMVISILIGVSGISFYALAARNNSREFKGYEFKFGGPQDLVSIFKNGNEVMRLQPKMDYVSISAMNEKGAVVGELSFPVKRDGGRGLSAVVGIPYGDDQIEYHQIFESNFYVGDGAGMVEWGRARHASNAKETPVVRGR